MTYKKYPDDDTVNFHIREKLALTVAVPFDKNKPVLISVGGEDHFELVSHFEAPDDPKSRYFCIYAEDVTATWVCECSEDYKGIKDVKSRNASFYGDGCSAIAEVLADIGYFSDLRIPTKYKKRLYAACDIF